MAFCYFLIDTHFTLTNSVILYYKNLQNIQKNIEYSTKIRTGSVPVDIKR